LEGSYLPALRRAHKRTLDIAVQFRKPLIPAANCFLRFAQLGLGVIDLDCYVRMIGKKMPFEFEVGLFFGALHG
jgi:hypothetical protein